MLQCPGYITVLLQCPGVRMYINLQLQYPAHCPRYNTIGHFCELGPLGPFRGCYNIPFAFRCSARERASAGLRRPHGDHCGALEAVAAGYDRPLCRAAFFASLDVAPPSTPSPAASWSAGHWCHCNMCNTRSTFAISLTSKNS
jgi:hypothetical protein